MKKLLYIACLVFTVSASAQTDAEKARKIDSIFTAYANQSKFNGAIVVAHKGNVVLSKGYGKADFRRGILNTSSTKFKLASVSKQFTAMAILILEEQGKLSVNDKLSKYIPDYPKGDSITVHHLLTHTSGIKNFTDMPLYHLLKTKPHTMEQLIAHFKDLPLDFEPGTKMSYSNSGYVLLTDIIEKASGKSYGTYMREAIFAPLGMKNTGLWDTTEAMGNVASGYSETDTGFVSAPYISMTVPRGAGALYSTVDDLLLWDQAFNSEKLVKKSTLERMVTPFKKNYAYGLKVDDHNGRKWISHGGGIEGFVTSTNRFPEDELYIAILKNVDNQQFFPATKVARAIMLNEDFVLPKVRTVATINTDVYQTFVGEYELEPGFVFNITTEPGRLFTQATGQPRIEVFPESEYRYFVKDFDAQISFNKDDKGNVTSLTLFQGGAEMPAKRIK